MAVGGEGEADPLPDGARARGQPLERGAVRGQPGLVGWGEHAQQSRPAAGPLVDLVQVARLPERVTNQSRAAIRVLTVEMICQVPDPVAPADLVQAVRADELLRARASAPRPGVVPCTTRVAIRSVTSGRTRPGSAATWSAGT